MSGAGTGAYYDPDPAVRLANWRAIARQHISVETCLRLARFGMPDLAREQLTVRLVGGDHDFALRCRRAAAMAALGQLRDDPAMLSAAVELAIRECREKPALTPAVVFAVSGPIRHKWRHDPAALDPALVAEIAAVTAAMVYPDAGIGSL